MEYRSLKTDKRHPEPTPVQNYPEHDNTRNMSTAKPALKPIWIPSPSRCRFAWEEGV